jgi:HD-GYP domain-containing protein (c-di-GMP phosphodiesterase class II)
MRLVRRTRDEVPEAGTGVDAPAPQLRLAPIVPRRLRDHWLEGHTAEVAELALAVGRRLGLSGQALFELELTARLHDVGKGAIPHGILNKPGPLTRAEWAVMRRHPEWGSGMLAAIPGLEAVAEAVYGHHERWDGEGYPRGLAGEAIPLASRIVAVCDAYSAMTTDRPYRAARPAVEAVGELRRCAGSQFDPRIVEAFVLRRETAAIA